MKKRFIEWDGARWPLRHLASAHGIAPGTLYYRLRVLGETPTGIARALATGIVSRSEAGRRGALASPWGKSVI